MADPSTATNEAVLITDPPPPSSKYGIPCLQHRNTLRKLVAWTRSQASRDVSTHRRIIGRGDAGVVEQNVDPAQFRTNACVEIRDCRLVDEVGNQRQLAD